MADETVMPGAPHGAAADRDPWAPPPSDGPTDSADSPKISLGKTSAPTAPAPAGAPDGRPADGGTGRPAAAPLSAPAPWAAPGAMAGPGTGDAPGAADGPGHTVFSSGPPAPASVHEQQTLASAPGGTDAAQRPGAWSEPNPFAPPQPGDPRAANPFAPPGPAYGEPVPPPPIAPEGPGQVPYGYPGGYGYPGAAGPGGAHGPQGGYYGWPGMQPLPSNGMGTRGWCSASSPRSSSARGRWPSSAACSA